MGIEDFIDEGQEIKTKKEQVLLIDLHNLAMRNLYAQPYDPTDVSFLRISCSYAYEYKKIS